MNKPNTNIRFLLHCEVLFILHCKG